MSQNIGKRMVSSFKNGGALTKLIYINILVFILPIIFYIPFMLADFDKQIYYDTLLGWLGVPADLDNLQHCPWSIISYMFVHFNFMHLLFNMLWLHWFGSLFLTYFSNKQLTTLYLMGGIIGAFTYILSFNSLPFFSDIIRVNSWTIGASASIMAITLAVCTHMPQSNVYIFLLGPVRLVYVALFIVFIDIISIQTSNPGGHIAHLGGALTGILFTLAVHFSKKGSTHQMKFENQSMHTPKDNPKRKNHEQINDILDKISNSGYDSLTREEKSILFKADEK